MEVVDWIKIKYVDGSGNGSGFGDGEMYGDAEGNGFGYGNGNMFGDGRTEEYTSIFDFY
jgi:hypothetical protein